MVKAITSWRTLAFNLVDARDVNARPLAQFPRGLARDDSGFGQRFGGGQLDVEPLLEFVFLAPDAAHLRTRVPCDQFSLCLSVAQTLLSVRIEPGNANLHRQECLCH